ncbi:MAG: hypothetical protein P1V51_21735 [Deltaproteobacteria bacterium]|nr:hypothetical protein [Deltaproteobacteria bacterium]
MKRKYWNLAAALGCTGLLLLSAGCPVENAVQEETETTIEGGTRVAVSPDGRLTVDFTRGAVAEGTLVTVGFSDLTPTGLVGRAYRLGPEGLTFDGPVTMRFDVGDYQPGGTLVLANLDGAAPQVIEGSTYDPAARTLTGNLRHFSNYGAIDISAPCFGRACGEPCNTCPDGDPSCIPMGAPTYCDANGACVPGAPDVDGSTCAGRAYDPCAGLACGDTCSLCPPDATGCLEPAVVLTCNDAGLCGMNQPTCGAYVPCAGAACGEPCSLCPPDATSCVEPGVLMTCDGFGACVYADPAQVDCGILPPPPPECQGDLDCAPGEICVGEAWCTGCSDPNDPTCDGVCYSHGVCLPTPGDPCAGKLCGELCNPCDATDPADPNQGCAAVMGVCDGWGACVMPDPSGAVECGGVVPPPECNADADCAPGEACLPYEYCPPCVDADPACAMPCYAGWACQPTSSDCAGLPCGELCATPDGLMGFCDANGACSATAGGAPPACGGTYQPCAGKACGDTCQLCDPADASCAETDVVKWCDASGGCSWAFPECGTNAPPSECQADADCPSGAYCIMETWCPDCANDPTMPCGAPCMVYGVCQTDGLPYDPCRGKACGEGCTLCDPNDPTCAETAVLKSCDAWGQCRSSIPACGVTGDFCGGFAGVPCAPGHVCVDDPTDNCDPATGADCAGICEPDATCASGDPSCVGQVGDACGGFAGLPCAQGLLCVDDPSDDCDPNAGGADCPGICQ